MNARTGPVAYMTSEYPKFSHTFIQREVAALRSLGEEVETCATRRPPVEALNGPEEEAEYHRTFAILERAKNPLALIADLLSITLTRPSGVIAAFVLALGTRAPGGRGLIYAMIYLAEAMVLARRLRRSGPRRIHAHFANAACTVAMLAARILKTPYSFTLHGPTDFDDPEISGLPHKLRHAQFVACISHYARGKAMAHLGADQAGKLHIIHCGVDPARYADAPPPAGQGLVFVGRLAEVKGVPLLLEAFSRLHPDFSDAKLTIVGDGELRAVLEADVRAKGLESSIRFTGALSQGDVAQELAQADIFILPSYAEGVPVVLMEAMAAGRPVVTSRINGIPELVEDGVSGRLNEAGDVDALTGALRDLLQSPETCRAYGEAGRAMVVAEFDIAGEARRLASLFRAYDAGTPPADIRPL